MTFVVLILAVFWLACGNGANDNFKGVATLYGSGTFSYRGALNWATFATLAGSILSIPLAGSLAKSFSGKGLVPAELAQSGELLISVAAAAAVTILLATFLGMPTSTTHALTGALAILVVSYEIGCREDELSAWTRRRFRPSADEDGKPYWCVRFVQKLSRMRFSRLSDNVMNMLFEMWDIMGFEENEDHAAFPRIGRRNFGGPIQRGAISKDIDILFANAGLGHLTTHSTRLGAINRLLDNGANPLEIAKIVGMSLQMVQRYARRHFERRRVGNLLSLGMDKIYSPVVSADLATCRPDATVRRPGQGYRHRERAEIISALRNANTKNAAAKTLSYSREWLRKKIKEHKITDDEWR